MREGVVASNNYADEEYHFESICDRMDSTVKATEQTTNRIMATVEKSGEMVDQIRNNPSVNQVNTLPDNITKNNTNVF